MPDSYKFAYELIEAALSEARAWEIDPEEIGLSGYDPDQELLGLKPPKAA